MSGEHPKWTLAHYQQRLNDAAASQVPAMEDLREANAVLKDATEERTRALQSYNESVKATKRARYELEEFKRRVASRVQS